MGKPPFNKGDQVGSYTIEGTFSIGGMGVVYTSEAGKVLLKSPFADAELEILNQFQEEVEALQKLNHPGIVKILAAGYHDEIPWYAMERLEGETLRDRLKRKGHLDDSIDVRICATQILSQEHQVISIKDWPQALGYIFQEELDLILLDVNMPGYIQKTFHPKLLLLRVRKFLGNP